MTDLLPCPFCGRKPKLFRIDFDDGYYVECSDGKGLIARTKVFNLKEDAVRVWNRRTT